MSQSIKASEITGNVKITEDQLEDFSNQVRLSYEDAKAFFDTTVNCDIAESFDYYYGRLPKRICSGSSKWVDRTVWESVNGVTQELMNVFTSGEQAVKFKPLDAKDAVDVIGATKLVNEALLVDNDGYNVLQSTFKDACTLKASFTKTYWEETTKTHIHSLNGLTENEVSIFLATLQERTSEEIDTDFELNEETQLIEGKVSYTVDASKVKVEFVPLEQMVFSSNATDKNMDFIGQRTKKTVSELLDMGFDESVLEDINVSYADEVVDYLTSGRSDEDFDRNQKADSINSDDKLNKELNITEIYIKSSIISDEVELYQVFLINGEVVDINRVNNNPFTAFVPLPIPNSILGESVTSIVKDIQDLSSYTMRGMIDNIMNANLGRYTGLSGAYDKKSFLDGRAGGITDLKTIGAINPLPHNQLPQGMDSLMEYTEQRKEQRIGVTRLGQGLNSDVFKNDNSEGMVASMLSASQNRLRMICRNIAHGGMSDLMLKIYSTIRENRTTPITVTTVNGELRVMPYDLPERNDVSVSVAVGNEERKARGVILSQLASATQQNVMTKDLISPEQAYYTAVEIYHSQGIFDVENYITKPAEVPKSEPTPQAIAEAELAQEEVAKKKAETLNIHSEIKNREDELIFKQQKAGDEENRAYENSLTDQDNKADVYMLSERKQKLEEEIARLDAEYKQAMLELKAEELKAEYQLELTQGRAVKLGAS